MSRPAARKPLRTPISGPSRPTKPILTGAVARDVQDGYLYVAGIRDVSKRVTEFSDAQDVCPVCHTDRGLVKNLRLLVSPCYHKMCESCIDRLFALGPSPCPQCGRVLRKYNFAHQTFEDLRVEKEVSVRRRIAAIYNKEGKDFKSSREYDDYLEQVEEITFNLQNDTDVAATEAKIKKYQSQNKSLIESNKQKAAFEAMGEADREELIRAAKEKRRRAVEENERFEEVEERRVKAEIVELRTKGDQAGADALKVQAAKEKTARAEALEVDVEGLATIYNIPIGTLPSDGDHSDPLSAYYDGPYIPIPYSNPDEAEWKDWYQVLDGYVDGREGVRLVKDDKAGTVRGGGFDLKGFWEGEIRCGVEGLGIRPLGQEEDLVMGTA